MAEGTQNTEPSTTAEPLSTGDFADMMLSGMPVNLEFGGESPVNGTDSAAGDTPAEPVPVAATVPGSEAAPSAVLAGDPPVDAALVPAVDAVVPPTDDDLLKDSAPFSYAADGATKTVEGIIKLNDGSGIIDPEYMPMLAHRLGERDHLFKTAGEQREQIQRFERISQWDQPDGKGGTTRLTGEAAIRAQHFEHADDKAELAVLRDVLRDGTTLRALIDGVDEAGNIVLNKQALANLDTRVENHSLKMRQALSEYYGTLTAPKPSTPSAPDYAAASPNILNAVTTQLGVTLHADDAKQLAGMVPLYLRPATPADVQLNPSLKVGEAVVDPKFYQQVTYLHGLRSETSKAVTTAQAASTKAAEVAARNASRQAAAANGVRQPTAPVVPAKPVNPAVEAARTKRQLQDDAYAHSLAVARAAMG